MKKSNDYYTLIEALVLRQYSNIKKAHTREKILKLYKILNNTYLSSRVDANSAQFTTIRYTPKISHLTLFALKMSDSNNKFLYLNMQL